MTIALSRHVRLATLTLLVSTVAGAQQRVEETFFVPVPERINFLAPDPLRPVAIGAAADGSVVSLGSASASGLPAVNAVPPDRAGEDCLFAGRLFPCLDLYLVRVLPDGQGPAYMTYLGGPNQEQAQDLAVAPDGTAYILATGGLDWLDPSVDLSEPGSVPSESDAFILRVSPSGAPEALIRLPRAPERYSSIDLDSAGAVYLAGTVHSGIEPINGFGNEKFELTLYRSKDGGDVWDAKPTEAPPLADHLLAVDADGLTQLWTYGREGVFFSHDLGRKWTRFAAPVEPMPSDFVVAPGETPTVYLFGAYDQMYRSIDGAFEPLFLGSAIAVSDAEPSLVRAATNEDLRTSRDGGLTWSSRPFPTGYSPGNSHIWPHPSRPEVFYLQVSDSASFRTDLLASFDDGSTWMRIDRPVRDLLATEEFYEIFDLEISPSGSLYLATSHGLFRTDETGASWILLDNGFPPTEGPADPVWAIEIDAEDPRRLSAAARRRESPHPRGFFLITSPDGGDSWALAAQAPREPTGDLAADPTEPGVVYALGGFRHNNAFVMKLAPALDRIDYLSIYGGSGRDSGNALVVDSTGRAYVAGDTLSGDLPAVAGGVREEPGGAFVARLAADGSRVEQATYFGGTGILRVLALAIGPDGSIFLRGPTLAGGDFPLIRPAREVLRVKIATGFLAKLSSDLGEILYSTFLSGTSFFGSFGSNSIAADAAGRVHVLRSTDSFDPPAVGASAKKGAEATALEVFSPEGDVDDVLYFDDARALSVNSDDRGVVVGLGLDGLVPGHVARLTARTRSDITLRPQLGAAYLARLGPDNAAPYIGSIVNAAAFRTGPSSPGEIVSMFGQGLGPDGGLAFELVDGRTPRSLGGTEVLFGDVQAPLLFSGNGQINATTPFSLEAGDYVSVHIRRAGSASNRIWQHVASADPGVFTLNGMRIGDAAILNEDGTINSPLNPAPPGSVISIFATGGGKLTPSLEADEIAGLPLSHARNPVRVDLLQFGAEVLYAGSAPGLVAGVLQINVRILGAASALTIVDVKIQVGDALSIPLQAFVSIKGPASGAQSRLP